MNNTDCKSNVTYINTEQENMFKISTATDYKGGHLYLNEPFIVFDVETTGFDHQNERMK